MIIKKFLAKTEREAIEMAKEELGSGAVVMNIKKVHPKGIAKLFMRTKVEVTAALDESLSNEKEESKGEVNSRTSAKEAHLDVRVDAYQPDIILDHREEEKDVAKIEEKLNSLQKMLEERMKETSEEKQPVKMDKEDETTEVPEDIKRTDACMELILKQLVDNDVEEAVAEGIISEIQKSVSEDATVDNILTSIYQKIILMLGQPYRIQPIEGKTKYVFFVGSTGVGKTTTIAKLASELKLNQKKKVALATSDTYRIAAVEQLKTYANILDVPLKVIYEPEELNYEEEKEKDYDVYLIDTAGRSHRNKEQIDDIRKLIEQVPIAEREVYLVLNAGTKYSDLKQIAKVYSEITDYSIIFTKLDETSCEGVLLNMRVLTNNPLSYVTWGQNVPDDIGEVDAQKVAKKLLGGK